MKKLSITLTFITLALISCKDNAADGISTDKNISNASPRHISHLQLGDMEYTSYHELYELYSHDNTNVIHYNVARLLAETELIAGGNIAIGENVDPNEKWYLTPCPKVIYNFDNTPKYYEFGYVSNGEIVATVTTYAQKEIDGVIAYLFSAPLSYDIQNYDYYVGKYPDRYYGRNGNCYLDQQGEIIVGDLPEYASTSRLERERMLERMPLEDLQAIEYDMHTYNESIDEDTIKIRQYWDVVDSYIIDNMPDVLAEDPSSDGGEFDLYDFIHHYFRSIEIEYVAELIELLEYQLSQCYSYTLPEYEDMRLQYTRWTEYCGPAACAWVYRGKYNSYNGSYLLIFGDEQYLGDINYYFVEIYPENYAYYDYWGINQAWTLGRDSVLNSYLERSQDADNGLAGCFYRETVPFIWNGKWEFPLYHGGLNRGFMNATNGDYHVYFTCKPLDCILQNRQPVIIAINCDHYIVAFGYWATVDTRGNVKDKYFKITDNGLTTGPSYHPYTRKVNCWDLHYGLTH